MQPSTTEAEDHQRDNQNGQAPFPTHLALSAITAAGMVVLMLTDMAAPVSFVPVQFRILALAAVLGTLILYLDKRRDDRERARYEELIKVVTARNKSVEFCEAYVLGLRREPLDGETWHRFT